MTLGNDDNGTDGQTDRVRRNMRRPPREEGRIIIVAHDEHKAHCKSRICPRTYPRVLPFVAELPNLTW